MTYEKAAEAAAFIKERYPSDIRAAIVLGSGLGAFAEKVDGGMTIPFAEIPGFVRSTVEGHAGQLVIGDINGVTIAVQQGRFHYYEGYEMEQVMLPVRTFGVMGIKNLILTNAAGSLNSDMPPGSLMMITDHINCFGVNPLRGPNDSRFGARFPDMTEVYDRELQRIVDEEAAAISTERNGIDFLNKGIYCGLSGPTYETPSEVRMYRLLGADAVGMSTVPEAVAARHMGVRVLGISCITNYAAGMTDEEIDHSHVMTTGADAAEVFGELLTRVISRI
ncbi:MAG: purine-nucleoside phosphorylase [Chloracidobacterium sp.]|nr:purine-nucleoside phosphorylase [Chloracidobacterium sp.]